MSYLSLKDVAKTYRDGDSVVGLRSIDLDVEQGEFITLLGPSGCGKTTTLRCIAGLERPNGGEISLDGRVLYSNRKGETRFVPPESRGLSMVFQNYALWPHMDVFDNVAFGLRNQGASKAETASNVERALKSVDLWKLRGRRISQLSGGQQQRIAVARALAPNPKVVLFDEPLSNVDAQLRQSMRLEILELQMRMGLTAVWVTHDQEEALSISSRIVVMNDGRVEQTDKPHHVWESPRSAFVAGFLGSTNVLRGAVERDPAGGPSPVLSFSEGVRIVLPDEAARFAAGDPVEVYVRSGALQIVDDPRDRRENVWTVPVEVQSFHGDFTLVVVRLGGLKLQVMRDGYLPEHTEHVHLHIDPESLFVFAA